MKPEAAEQQMYMALRVASAMCFIGHGVFGIITKPIWCNYFAVVGIGKDAAYQLMPLVGIVDIVLGIVLLVYPLRAVAFWLVIWGLLTASMRPLSGESFGELIERAGNYGVALSLLLLCQAPEGRSGWLQPLKSPVALADQRFKGVQACLRIAGFLLLAGHGWLNLIAKKGLVAQYDTLGFSDPQQVAMIAGGLEILFAAMVLLKPVRLLLLLVLIWKMGSELFYPHYELFEWVERGGSYGVLLALWFSLQHRFDGNSSGPLQFRVAHQ